MAFPKIVILRTPLSGQQNTAEVSSPLYSNYTTTKAPAITNTTATTTTKGGADMVTPVKGVPPNGAAGACLRTIYGNLIGPKNGTRNQEISRLLLSTAPNPKVHPLSAYSSVRGVVGQSLGAL